MKTVEIFVIGKYEYKTNIGTWIYYLNYKKAVIKRVGTIHNAGSPNRVSLFALYSALQCVKEPCKIIVHSKAALGFKNPKQSHNKELIFKIQTLINKAGHVISFDTTDDFGRVNIWEQVYGKNSDGTKPNSFNNKISKPDITNAKKPNDVFSRETPEERDKREQEEYDKHIEEMAASQQDWRLMYSDLMCESNGNWVDGMGGY